MTTTDDRTDEADRSWWITVGDVMNRSPLTIPEGASVRDAVVLVVNGLANDLMVVGAGGRFAGLLAEGDILRRALPNREEILAAGGTVEDGYRTFVRRGGEIAAEPIDALVIRKPVLVAPGDHVAKVAAILVERNIRTLAVVEGDRLVGSVSRAEVCGGLVRAH